MTVADIDMNPVIFGVFAIVFLILFACMLISCICFCRWAIVLHQKITGTNPLEPPTCPGGVKTL